MNNWLSIISSIFAIIAGLFKAKEVVRKIEAVKEKQKDVDFKSDVEKTVFQANSGNEKDKEESLKKLRNLLSD